jgi:hypothetical protein
MGKICFFKSADEHAKVAYDRGILKEDIMSALIIR